MPEGDTVFLTGTLVGRALNGRTLTATDFRVPSLATVDLAGAEFSGVRTVGKHLFFRFRDTRPGTGDQEAARELSLHSHLRMDGAWRTVQDGRRWRVPGHHVRVVLTAGEVTAVGVRVHDLALLATSDEHRWTGRLGPDLLDPGWTEEHDARAVTALSADPGREVGIALLDQTCVAGIGNLYKAEICFLAGVTPWTPVSDVDVPGVVELARKLLRANAARWEQSTTGELARGRRTWVYDRSRLGCFRCGGPVRVAPQGKAAESRPTWFCPRCQHGRVPGR